MSIRRTALLIGTSVYDDPALQQLLSPDQDVETLATVLRDPLIADFQVTTMINRPHHEVGEKISQFYENRRHDDLTLLYFSCHGLKDADGRLYLAMRNTKMRSPMFSALSAEAVRSAMEVHPRHQQVLVLDCCYSGAFPSGLTSKSDGAAHSVERFRGRGRAILTASDALQYSFEGEHVVGEGTRSLFTRFLIDGIRTGEADLDHDGEISLDELYTYVHDRMSAHSPAQRPMKQEDIEGRISVARNINWEIPDYVRNAISSPMVAERISAIGSLRRLAWLGNDIVRSRVLQEATLLVEDDSRQVSGTACELRDELLGKEDETGPQPTALAQVKLPSASSAASENLQKVVPRLPELPEFIPTTTRLGDSEPRPASLPDAADQEKLAQVRQRAVAAVLLAALVTALIVLTFVLPGHNSNSASSPSNSSTTASPPLTPPVSLAQPIVGSPIKLGGGEIGFIAVSPKGDVALASDRGGRTVKLLKLPGGSILHSYDMMHTPRSITFSPDATRGFVSLYDDSVNDRRPTGYVAILDLLKRGKPAVIEVGEQPYNSAISPDGKWLYVPNHGSKSISVVDVRKRKQIDKVAVQVSPHSVILTRDGRNAYVAIHEGNGVAAAAIDGKSWGPVSYTSVGDHMSPHALSFSPDEKAVFVADYEGGKVTVIRRGLAGKPDQKTRDIELNVVDGPQAIAVAPDGKHVYVCVDTSNEVVSIDTENFKVVDRVRVQSSPTSLALTPDGRTAYVTPLHSRQIVPLQISK